MYTEFLAATIEAHGYIAEERVAEAFDRLDADETGYSKCHHSLARLLV
jgi:calcium-dependent protein kinase